MLYALPEEFFDDKILPLKDGFLSIGDFKQKLAASVKSSSAEMSKLYTKCPEDLSKGNKNFRVQKNNLITFIMFPAILFPVFVDF